MAVTVNVTVCWDVIPPILIDIYQCFGGTPCLHLQILRWLNYKWSTWYRNLHERFKVTKVVSKFRMFVKVRYRLHKIPPLVRYRERVKSTHLHIFKIMIQLFLGVPSETSCATHDHVFSTYCYSDMLTNYAVMKFWSTVGKQFYKAIVLQPACSFLLQEWLPEIEAIKSNKSCGITTSACSEIRNYAKENLCNFV
jgi:hypothetical protein